MTLPATQSEPVADERALEPGAMQVVKTRPLRSGHLVTFEYAPQGWLTQKGEPRYADWRRYYITPDGAEIHRREHQAVSVTTICDAILPKDGLPPWSEKAGIFGAREAMRRGIVSVDSSEDEWLQAVRSHKLGADALRDRAADRGLNVHAILERYMLTGEFDNPADHPEPHRPFIKGLARAVSRVDLEPIAVEMLVGHPEYGYAGRLDLLAHRGGSDRLTLVDLKTQERGGIYESAHVQVRLYWEAERAFGEHEIDEALIIVVDGYGGFDEMELIASPELAADALAFYQRLKPVCSACNSRNRMIREALEASA